MRDMQIRDESRRRVLRVFVTGALGVIGAALAAMFGRFAVVPRAATESRWLRAAALADLDTKAPTAVVVAVARQDGWARIRANETLFVTWDGLTGVRAFSATCTHLGCRVRWDGGAHRFKCPCHGGEYDAEGKVIAGPPPRPLNVLEARITDDGDVEVRL